MYRQVSRFVFSVGRPNIFTLSHNPCALKLVYAAESVLEGYYVIFATYCFIRGRHFNVRSLERICLVYTLIFVMQETTSSRYASEQCLYL